MQNIISELNVYKKIQQRNNTPIISCFGGARYKQNDSAYKKAQFLARNLALNGYSILTGGGPGIMEALNRGAKEGILRYSKKYPKKDHPKSIGLNILLPFEQKNNAYLQMAFMFENFFTRKHTFIQSSCAFIVLPGGFGTLDELSDVLTLMATKKIPIMPIILYDSLFWADFIKWLQNTFIKQRTISKSELHFLTLADTPKEVLQILKDRVSQPKHHKQYHKSSKQPQKYRSKL